MSLLSFLFPEDQVSNEWTQTQREALIDLLYLAIYEDNHLSQTEEHAVKSELNKIDWDDSVLLESYIDSSIKRARDARNNEGYKTDYLVEIGSRLDTETAKSKALESCGKVLSSDGLEQTEDELLDVIRNAWT